MSLFDRHLSAIMAPGDHRRATNRQARNRAHHVAEKVAGGSGETRVGRKARRAGRLSFDLDRTGDSGGRRLGFIIIRGAFGFLSQEPAAVVNALSKQEIHLAAESKCYISMLIVRFETREQG